MGNRFILLVILALICLTFSTRPSEVERIPSNLTGESYIVRNLPDKKLAAETLADLHLKLQQLISYTRQTDPDHPGVRRLAQKFQGKISERTAESLYTSYTVNKGEHVHMCIRHTDNSLVDRNTIFYVGLHEMAHIMTLGQGHTDDFKANFKFLVHRALDHGLYQYKPYHVEHQEYCGIQIKNTPVKGGLTKEV